MVGVVRVDEQRYLMRAKGALVREPIDHFWSGPAFGRAQHNHRPTRPSSVVLGPCPLLNLADILDCLVQRGGHELVHLFRVVTFDEERTPARAAEKLLQLLALDTR